MYYLYQHIRNDTNEVFYVGIGDKYRPNEKSSRNKFWENIVSKTEYTVEIIKSFKTWEEACDWEMFLIATYGRRVDGDGPLVNMTFGGEGTNGLKHSKETIEKRKESLALKKSYAIDAYDIKTRHFLKSYISITEAANDLNINKGGIYACVNKIQYYTKGYTFCHYGETPEWDQIEYSIAGRKSIRGREKFLKRFSKPVLQYSIEGDLIAEYPSASEATRSLNKTGSSIVNCANGKKGHYTAYGYKWKWKQ